MKRCAKATRTVAWGFGFALVLGFATNAQAANHFVRAGASGNGSGADWTNAYTTLPTTLTRGDVYFVAGGTYASRTFSTAASGTSVITIKGATAAAHGTDSGWSSTFGVDAGQATFGSLTFTSSYWVFDGSVGSLTTNRAAYGFAVSQSSDAIRLGGSSSGAITNMTFAHIAMQAPTADVEKTAIRGTTSISGMPNLTVQHCLFDGFEGSVVSEGSGSDASGWLVEYNYFLNGSSTSAHHGEDINANSNGIASPIIRYNTFDGTTGGKTGTIVANNASITSPEIYGNLFVDQIDGNGIITSTSTGTMSNAKVYNNTFVNCKPATGIWVNSNGGDASNNLLYNMQAVISGVTHDYNAYFQTTNTPSETNRQTATTNPFVNSGAGNYHLSAATTAGTPLASPYNVDADGKTRGADGKWDRGAFEFSTGSTSTQAPASPTNVRIVP